MPLDIPDGTSCFIDANVFCYHFVETPSVSVACTAFIERIARGQVLAHASAHVLAEAVHKIMLAEAAAKFGLNRVGLVSWLQRHRDRFAELSEFREAVVEIRALPIVIVPIDFSAIERAATLSRQWGLLTNDALILALMNKHGLTDLASNDNDFDNVSGIKIWKPR